MLRKSSELSIKDFYCVFVRTEMNLIAFSGPRNCINTQYAALSGAMHDRVEHENSDGYREIRTELKGKSDSCFFLQNKAL